MRFFVLFVGLYLSAMSVALPADPGSALVMSINLASHKDAATIAHELEAAPGPLPDILLLQEVKRTKGRDASVADELGRRLGMHTAFAAPGTGATNVGVAVLSRWEISDQTVRRVPRFYKLIRVRPRLALGVTVRAPSGPIRVWTTHLDTRISVTERLRQLQPILNEADTFQGPSILGGDLNTLSLSWLLHSVPIPAGNQHARAVTDLMRKHGFHTPFTENAPTFDLFGFQLDWVYLRGLSSIRSGIHPLKFSDHHAVWTEFSTAQKPETSSALADRR